MRVMTLILAGLALAAWPGTVVAQDTTDKPVLVLDSGGHTAPVTQVLFTPDDRQVITVSKDKTVRIWDAASGETVRVLRPPIGPDDEGRLFCAALSPRGRLLAVAGMGVKGHSGAIYVIALASGRVERVLTGHSAGVHALAFSPDGSWLASGSNDTSIRLWNLVTGKDRVLVGHTTRVLGLAFAPDSKRLVSVSHGKAVLLWTVGETKPSGALPGMPAESGVAWSPDGKLIAIAHHKGTIDLWNANGTLRKQLNLKAPGTHSLQFTNDSRALFLAGSRCGLVDLDGKELVAFNQHTKELIGGVVNGTLSHNNELAVTAGQADEVFIWRRANASLVQRLGGQGQTNRGVGWSADGQTVIWDTQRTKRPLHHTFSLSELEAGGAAGEAYRPSLRAVDGLSLDLSKHVTVLRGKTVVNHLKIHKGARQCATLVPSSRAGSGPRLAVGGTGLALYEARTGKELRTFKGAHGIFGVAPSKDGRYLVTASDNQALTVWDVDRDDALLSLFVAGREWIVWTSEGYYASSPGGEQLMGWHVNNGRDQLATFHPAAHFRSSLYRPDVIKRLLKAGSVQAALKQADTARGQKTTLVDIANVLPPTVLLTVTTDPKSPQEIKVKAEARPSTKHPILTLRLFLDGRPYDGNKGIRKVAKPGPGPVSETWPVKLPAGTQQLAVQAETAVSRGFSEPFDIVASRGLKPVAMAPEKLKQELPRMHVLAIGVSKYKQKGLALAYATKDAEALARTFASTSKGLFRPGTIEVLTDAGATQANILDRLDKLPNQVAPGDVAVITFAGHGVRDKRTGKFFLLPVNADPDKLLSTCVDGDQVKGVLASLDCKVILVLDACHSGAVGGVESMARVTDNLVRDLVTEERGVIVMCAAMGREVALENAKVGHGFFTKALMEGLAGGLKGEARSKDGLVYLHQLDAYINERVKDLSGDQQHPAITRPTSIRSFALARP